MCRRGPVGQVELAERKLEAQQVCAPELRAEMAAEWHARREETRLGAAQTRQGAMRHETAERAAPDGPQTRVPEAERCPGLRGVGRRERFEQRRWLIRP